MSSQFQVAATKSDYNQAIIDSVRDFEDIYWDKGPPNFEPIDKNKNIDLAKYMLSGVGLTTGTTYWRRVRNRDRNMQWSGWTEEHSFTISSTSAVDKNRGTMPGKTELYANYPNPFNPATTIRFDVAKPGRVTIEIYSLEGRLVKTVLSEGFNSGQYSAIWGGTNFSGKCISSRTYFITMIAGKYRRVEKTAFIK